MSDALGRLDLLALDDDVADENRLLRSTVRKFADDRLRPNIRDWFESGELPARELAQEFGALGVLGMHLEGYGCQGSTATQYGIVCSRDRSGRFWPALAGQRAGLPRDVCDSCLRQRGTEAALAPGDGRGDVDRVLRLD
jgi:hypothetical protein